MIGFENFPEALRWLRISRKMTQADLAQALGVGKAVITNYESGRGRPSLLKLDAILRALRVDALELARTMQRVEGDKAAIRKRRYRPPQLPPSPPSDPRSVTRPVEHFLEVVGAAVAERFGRSEDLRP
jgi:transcriptional regulator with XRE-family HTH domain